MFKTEEDARALLDSIQEALDEITSSLDTLESLLEEANLFEALNIDWANDEPDTSHIATLLEIRKATYIKEL